MEGKAGGGKEWRYGRRNQCEQMNGGTVTAKEKTTGFYFKMSPEERILIEKAMAKAGVHNMSGYIRKMAINGYIVKLDLPELSECSKLLRSAANNLNQMARRVNSGDRAHQDRIAATERILAENRAMFGKILEGLAKIK